jgi:hypothetical protein
MLRELSEIYARRAREFSDTVARLGQYPEIGPEVLGLIQEIMRRRHRCDAAADKLHQYLERETNHYSRADRNAASALREHQTRDQRRRVDE